MKKKSIVGIFVDMFLQNVQRPGTVQDNVMELLDVKLVPELVPGHLPQLEYLHLSHLVSHGLSGPGHVPPHLPLDVVPAGGAVLHHVVHGLVHGPALGVHPRVHHQAARAEYVLTQVTKPVLGSVMSTP